MKGLNYQKWTLHVNYQSNKKASGLYRLGTIQFFVPHQATLILMKGASRKQNRLAKNNDEREYYQTKPKEITYKK